MTACSRMAATTTPLSAEPACEPPFVVAVAYSGGRDSTALLHATACVAVGGEWGPSAQVVALHVHHGLSLMADAWWQHTQAQCEQWAANGLPVHWQGIKLKGKPGKGESMEAWARAGRYQALADMARQVGADVVLLAHHRQDQAETFLLQALRGAGVAGLSAMPTEVLRDGVVWCRPWLKQPRAAVQAYVEAHGLSFIEDDSNADTRFGRNKLRLKVWPEMSASFDQAESALAQSASHMADANACLREWLEGLWPHLLSHGVSGERLLLDAWSRLSPSAQRLVLKAWVERVSGLALSHGWIIRLQQDWLTARSGQRWPLGGSGELRLHHAAVSWLAVQTEPQRSSGDAGCALAASWPCTIRRAGRHVLPQGAGVVQVCSLAEGGIPLALLVDAEWRIRSGGEQFQPSLGRPARTLKKQFQQFDVPAWARSGPLLWWGDRLLFVPGLGLDAWALALTGEPRVSLSWQHSL